MKRKQLTYENMNYQLDYSGYLKARVKLLWFPLRRWLRRTRRCVTYLGYWIVLFVPFSIISALLLISFVNFGLIELDDIPSFVLSLILGSFLLLVIKDAWDREIKRHETLVKQYEIYASSIYSADSSLQRIAEDCGLTLRGNARFPLLTETCWNSYHEQLSSMEISTINLEKLQTDLLCLKKTIMNLQGKMSVLPLIDNDDYSLDMNFNDTNMHIDNLQNAAASQDGVNARKHMQRIVSSSFHIFACLRRPWRYPIDINKQHALESWLDKHAVLKNSQSKIC